MPMLLRARALRRCRLVSLAVIALSVLTLSAQRQRFYPDDPIWREPITQDVKTAVKYEPDLAYQTIENLFWRPGDKVLGQRAKNINTLDEVPDGPYFVNRAGHSHGDVDQPAQSGERS